MGRSSASWAISSDDGFIERGSFKFTVALAGEVLATLNARGDIKGEITLLIGKMEEAQDTAVTPASVCDRVRQLISSEQLDEKAALKKVARELGISKSEAYRELQRAK